MARFMLEATADREQDIERWEKDMAEAATAGNNNLVAQIRCQSSMPNELLQTLGY